MTEQINWIILKTTVVQLPEILFSVEFLGIGINMQELKLRSVELRFL